MSKRKSRIRRRTVPSPTALARLLDTPQLARMVPHLAPETLHQLIRHSGLDACGELVAFATPEQLASVLDLDLWRHAQPGRDEQFDADRFAEWIELLVDTGVAVAARIVSTLDQDLVIAGLSRYLRVFYPAAIAPSASGDDEPIDMGATPSDDLECEVGGYLVRAIRAEAWDAIVALLLALDADYHNCFHAIMRGCRRLSNSTPELDSLDDRLMEPQQLLYDVAVDREHRRSQQGYSTPADARAFLQMARRRRSRQPDGTPSINPVAAAYFRAVHDTTASAGHDASSVARNVSKPASMSEADREGLDAIVGLLAEAGLVTQPPRALLEGVRSEPARLARIRPLMEYVRDTNDAAHLVRSRELAFLANTLVAGCSVQSRPLTAQEASDAVVGICNLGLELWPARWPGTGTRDTASAPAAGAALPDAFLVRHDLVTAFEVGWAALHEDVSMFVAEHLIVTLTDLRCVDANIQTELEALRRELLKQRDADTPWRARDALEVLAMLDLPAWICLLGLLDECPVLPAALTATLEGRIGAVSASAFEFISTTKQIGAVRAYVEKLPDVLRG
jgi:hypothetical protein